MMKCLVVLLLFLALCACDSRSGNNSAKLSYEDLITLADSISHLMSKYHYNPSELTTDEYLALEKEIYGLANSSQTREEFAEEFNKLWSDGPFSHVALGISDKKAEDMAEYFDTLRVGDQSVSLEWIDKTAVLTVKTMMGLDTYERIFETYQEIADKHANTLIIDIRNNPGGTFAIVPLVGHVLTDSMDAGMFVSRKWWNNNSEAPSMDDIQGLKSWQGWSLQSFWRDVQEQSLTRIQFKPMNPYFDGPVYVLISGESASATEFAIDALANVEKVTIIGETTAGEMLSQKMYDLPYGFQLSLPIAEYYSTRIGKIEGKGVNPDIAIDQSVAMDLAILLISGEKPEQAIAKVRLAIGIKDKPTFGAEKIYLFGNMNDWGKKWNITPQFEYIGKGIYETRTTFKRGKYEFKIAPMDWAFDYGANSDQEDVGIGKRTSLARVSGSGNLQISIEEEAKLTFTLDVSDDDAILHIQEH